MVEEYQMKKHLQGNVCKCFIFGVRARARTVDPTLRIIFRYCNRPRVFLSSDISDQGEPNRLKVQLFIRFVNDWMKGLRKELGFDLNLTTYVARHSFVTMEKYFAGFNLAAQAQYTQALVNI